MFLSHRRRGDELWRETEEVGEDILWKSVIESSSEIVRVIGIILLALNSKCQLCQYILTNIFGGSCDILLDQSWPES